MEREKLTKREYEVASLVALGLSNPEVASKLGVTRGTIQSHLERIYLKLYIKSRQELPLLFREDLSVHRVKRRSWDELFDAICFSPMTAKELAINSGCHEDTACRYLKRKGLLVKVRPTYDKKQFDAICTRPMTSKELARLCKCSETTAYNYLKKKGFLIDARRERTVDKT